MKGSNASPFTARQAAAILRLYVQQCLPSPETAKRLRLPMSRVVRFLRQQDVLRTQGGPGIPRRISLAARRRLESELPTTRDVVLARKYGVSKERVRQIRRGLGYPSSQILRHEGTIRARPNAGNSKSSRGNSVRRSDGNLSCWLSSGSARSGSPG